MSGLSPKLQPVFDGVKARNSNEPEFLQAAEEILHSLGPVVEAEGGDKYIAVTKALFEPERVIQFRVAWYDDAGELQVNRGFRVQMNSAIGPYKGGLRLHPTVNLSILKFLATEQVLKNAVTTLPLGGGKGGSDFNPKGRSEAEVRRFCQAFMGALARHIGPDTDVPAGDIGVSGREIGYLFGAYKRLTNRFEGVLTGKGPTFGGSLIRPQSTGYGVVMFVREMLKVKGDTLEGKVVVISGSGNVAQYATEKVNALGGKVIALSDSKGILVDEEGITDKKLAEVMDIKNVRRTSLKAYTEKYSSAKWTDFSEQYTDEDKKANPLWEIKCDVALPCATQNELNAAAAQALVDNGCTIVAEGANMPSTPGAIQILRSAKVAFAPGKASNAGGVATSGLEMSQNSQRLGWSAEKVEEELDKIMTRIHADCVKTAKAYDRPGDYVFGANVTGFLKVAEAMLAQGLA
ncbi:hypothetical protein MMPV_003747 [Pyropia vietnamensis]